MSITQSPEGFWTIDGDTHIGKWCRDSGRLDHDQNALPILRHYVRPGDFVLDIGANIGDHTIAYSDWVGNGGHVMACECNREAVKALTLNTAGRGNVSIFPHAVYSKECSLYFEEQENVGASYVSEMIHGQPVQAYSIDGMKLNHVDYIKIDAEGCETEILKGAKQTIEAMRPIIVLEVNESALNRCGSSSEELFMVLNKYHYYWITLFENFVIPADNYDIIARYQGL